MIEISIQDIKNGLIKGVEVLLPDDSKPYKETYFEWSASSLVCTMSSNEISGGILKAWHHVPVFKEAETHIDSEMFYFISGTAIMLFIDIVNGSPDLKSAQIVRIKPGTQIIIQAGKGHFVMVAENSEPVQAVVVSPKMDAPRITLPDTLMGI